ncbi:MAG: hypothetical protein WCW27_03640 [Patescibacteria group bacterium]|jgi:hypothetical protein
MANPELLNRREQIKGLETLKPVDVSRLADLRIATEVARKAAEQADKLEQTPE